jgi:hypothetical protein
MAMASIDDAGKIAPQVVVRPAGKSQRSLIEGLFQFYAYDWSEMEPADSPAFEIDAEGCFKPYPHFDEYWCAEDRWPLLIGMNERTVGFAMVIRFHTAEAPLTATWRSSLSRGNIDTGALRTKPCGRSFACIRADGKSP